MIKDSKNETIIIVNAENRIITIDHKMYSYKYDSFIITEIYDDFGSVYPCSIEGFFYLQEDNVYISPLTNKFGFTKLFSYIFEGDFINQEIGYTKLNNFNIIRNNCFPENCIKGYHNYSFKYKEGTVIQIDCFYKEDFCGSMFYSKHENHYFLETIKTKDGLVHNFKFSFNYGLKSDLFLKAVKLYKSPLEVYNLTFEEKEVINNVVFDDSNGGIRTLKLNLYIPNMVKGLGPHTINLYRCRNVDIYYDGTKDEWDKIKKGSIMRIVKGTTSKNIYDDFIYFNKDTRVTVHCKDCTFENNKNENSKNYLGHY